VSSQPHTPPMRPSNEAEPEQLEIARAQGSTYGRALQAMDEESGAVTQRAGDYLVAFVQEHAEGMYELEDGRLVWREAPRRPTSTSRSRSRTRPTAASCPGSTSR
jgi:hypothetical protein